MARRKSTKTIKQTTVEDINQEKIEEIKKAESSYKLVETTFEDNTLNFRYDCPYIFSIFTSLFDNNFRILNYKKDSFYLVITNVYIRNIDIYKKLQADILTLKNKLEILGYSLDLKESSNKTEIILYLHKQ